MTFDYTNLKPGDEVRLRNGDIETVTSVINNAKGFRVYLTNREYSADLPGHYLESSIDIVENLTNLEPEMPVTTPKDSSVQLLPVLIHSDESATINDLNLVSLTKITINGKRFTPADSWPEPITDRCPTSEDADENGQVMRLTNDGDWVRSGWDRIKHFPACSIFWARTSDWKPRPIDKKTLTIRDLKEAMRVGESPDRDTLQSAIELLEATP
jgi:hypothetical protein